MLPQMAPSMRLNAISRPPASHTATLTLMFVSWALVRAACTIRLASASVSAMSGLLYWLRELPLLGGRAAVDHQFATRHVGRFVGRQVDDAVGDVFGRSRASHRETPQALLPLRLVLQHVLDHVGRDRAGVDGVAADVLLGVLDGRRLGEEAHGALGRGVRGGSPWGPDQTRR